MFLSREKLLRCGNIVAINRYNIENYGKDVEFAELTKQYYSENRKEQSLLPTEYIDKTAKDFKWDIYGTDVEQQKKIINAFIINFDKWLEKGKGLYIYSEVPGSGKTLLACCLINELIYKRDINVKFISVVDLIELSKVKNKADEYDIKLNSVSNCKVLVLDDIGTEASKEWIEQFLYGFIDHRKKFKLITIYTSNIKPSNLKLNDRIKSRINETSIPIALPEVSIRDIKARKENKEFLEDVLG